MAKIIVFFQGAEQKLLLNLLKLILSLVMLSYRGSPFHFFSAQKIFTSSIISIRINEVWSFRLASLFFLATTRFNGWVLWKLPFDWNPVCQKELWQVAFYWTLWDRTLLICLLFDCTQTDWEEWWETEITRSTSVPLGMNHFTLSVTISQPTLTFPPLSVQMGGPSDLICCEIHTNKKTWWHVTRQITYSVSIWSSPIICLKHRTV